MIMQLVMCGLGLGDDQVEPKLSTGQKVSNFCVLSPLTFVRKLIKC
jgi:hypothetical protein